MYTSLAEIHRGWTRIFIHLFDKSIPALLHKVLLFLFFSILPFIVLGVEKFLFLMGSRHFNPVLFWVSAAVSGWIVMIRFIGNRRVRCNPWFALLHPLGSVILVWILSTCIFRIVSNRPSLWRGDKVN